MRVNPVERHLDYFLESNDFLFVYRKLLNNRRPLESDFYPQSEIENWSHMGTTEIDGAYFHIVITPPAQEDGDGPRHVFHAQPQPEEYMEWGSDLSVIQLYRIDPPQNGQQPVPHTRPIISYKRLFLATLEWGNRLAVVHPDPFTPNVPLSPHFKQTLMPFLFERLKTFFRSQDLTRLRYHAQPDRAHELVPHGFWLNDRSGQFECTLTPQPGDTDNRS